jgi:hypothetical protein
MLLMWVSIHIETTPESLAKLPLVAGIRLRFGIVLLDGLC